MKIGFLVGDIVNISGGSNVIVEHAAGLQAMGHEVVLIPPQEPPEGGAWHPRLSQVRVTALRDAAGERFDVVFATWWLTWFDLHRLDARIYGYFNQSLESRFHGERHYKLQNRATYSVPLLFVTEARWLEDFIRTLQPEAELAYVPNGLSAEYFPLATGLPAREGPLRVLVEGPWGVSFKGIPETFALLNDAVKTVPLEVGWLTSNGGGQRPRVGNREVRIYERIPINEVRWVYQQYDVLLKLSSVEGMYGPPLEMFSQGGTAITTPVSGCDEYVVHGANALLVEPFNFPQIARYLGLLSSSPDYLRMLQRNALKTAQQWPGWDRSTRLFADLLERLEARGYSNAHLRPTLAGVSSMRTHWLDGVWKNEAEDRARTHLGEGEERLVETYRRLKSTTAVELLKRATPPAVKHVLRELLLQVLP